MIRKIRGSFIFTIVFAAGALFLGDAPGVQSASAGYGAIAYSPSSGVWGYSYNYGSRGAAERRALRECRIRGGGCRSIVWFRNACGALASGHGNAYGWSWNTSRAAARRRAMRECRARTGGCRIRVDVCS